MNNYTFGSFLARCPACRLSTFLRKDGRWLNSSNLIVQCVASGSQSANRSSVNWFFQFGLVLCLGTRDTNRSAVLQAQTAARLAWLLCVSETVRSAAVNNVNARLI